MSNRNFDGRVIIQRLQNQVYARNLYKNNTAGQGLINNPQNTDGNASRFTSYIPGAQTEYFRGLVGSGETISVGGIVNIPPFPQDLGPTPAPAPPPIITVPGAPTGVSAVAGNAQATVTFTPPTNNGGATITRYTVNALGSIISVSGESSPIIVTGLTNGNGYEFTVIATNIIGNSVPSDPSARVIPFTTPSPPTNLSGDSGDGQIIVFFTPGSDGGSRITNYQYSTDNGDSFRAFDPAQDSNSVIISEQSSNGAPLTNGRTYIIKLKSVTNNGVSESSSSISLTPYTFIRTGLTLYYNFGDTASYPGPGGSGTTVTNLGSVTNTGTLVNGPTFSSAWGGILVFDGTNEYINTNNSFTSESFTINTWFRASTVVNDFRMLISKETLTSTPWNYRMFLYNGTGFLTGDITQSAGGPDISNNTSLADNIWHCASFSRDASTNTMKLYVDGALVNTNTDGISGSITNTQNVWIGLSAYQGGSYPFLGNIGSTFIYDRALTSDEVNSNYIATRARFFPSPPLTVPSASTGLSALAGNRQLTILFTPGSNGGTVITNYEYSTDNGDTFRAFDPVQASNSVIISQQSSNGTPLTNGTTYIVKLRAVNIIGVGAPSNSVSGIPGTIPDPPTDVVADPGNESADVLVRLPINTGGYPLNTYIIISDPGNIRISGPIPPDIVAAGGTVSGLTNGISYTFTSIVTNSIGQSFPSLPSNTVIPGTPRAPILGNITGANQKLIVNFRPPTSYGESAITNYKYSTDNGRTFNFSGTTTSPIIITGLTNLVTYDVVLLAVNSVGDGILSNMVRGTPRATVETFSIPGITTWKVPTDITSIEYVVVSGGGGGGGGYDTGGGGGGGGGMVLSGTFNVIPETDYTVVIGSGGTASTNSYPLIPETAGGPGGFSAFSKPYPIRVPIDPTQTIYALGGEGGKASRTQTGFSGKGGEAQTSSTAPVGGSGGGSVSITPPVRSGSGGGGGGSGGAGGNGTSSDGGAGGAGISTSITGTPFTYGVGGKGAKGNTRTLGSNGTISNGGGGGGWISSGANNGGRGGGGIVIIKY
jgi:hypothetical protein